VHTGDKRPTTTTRTPPQVGTATPRTAIELQPCHSFTVWRTLVDNYRRVPAARISHEHHTDIAESGPWRDEGGCGHERCRGSSGRTERTLVVPRDAVARSPDRGRVRRRGDRGARRRPVGAGDHRDAGAVPHPVGRAPAAAAPADRGGGLRPRAAPDQQSGI